MSTDKVRVMAKIFIDIVTGTWGEADDIVLVDLNDTLEDTQTVSGQEQYLDQASDSEIIDFGNTFGVPVIERPVETKPPLSNAEYRKVHHDLSKKIERRDTQMRNLIKKVNVMMERVTEARDEIRIMEYELNELEKTPMSDE